MSIYEELSGVAPQRDTVLTIGVFDGVHLGHQHLIQQVLEAARRRNCQSAVLTFLNHPRNVLQRGTPVHYITSVEERLDLLRATGVDLVVPVTFDLALSQLRAREFLALVVSRLRMRGLVVGPDFSLGHQREGDVPALQRLAEEMEFTLKVADLQRLGEVLIRSTSIRQALEAGDVALAARLLGRSFNLEGRVIQGRRRGRHLGFPTANLEVDPSRVLPGDGVYATWAHFNGRRFPSATNIGTRPTFNERQRVVETYVMDFNGDLYRRQVRVEFVRRLRDELRFESPEALRLQMERDVQDAQAALQAAEAAPR